jgi:hypothetical protein
VKKNTFYIDKVTRSIEDAVTGKSSETDVLAIGFEGIVGFRAKTRLIKHYMDTLGAELLFRDRMCIWEKSARKLVNSY